MKSRGQQSMISYDVDSTTECKDDSDSCKYTKLVKEFNAETARYHDQLLALGGSSDSEFLRDEMKRARKKACTLAVIIKDTFIPVLNDRNCELKSKRCDYERLWNTFLACVEVLEGHMRKTLDLQKSFPLHAGNCQFIQTGVMEPLGVDNIPVNIENLDVPNVDKMVLEREENNILARDILELRNMLSEMNRSVDIKPWTIEPLSEFSLNRSKSQSSLSDAASLIAFDPHYESRQRRKCTILVLTALATLIAFTTILIVCLFYVVE